MRYLITLFLLVLNIGTGNAQQPAAGINGTWTAEIHTGKVYLQVHASPPSDADRPLNGRGDWNMGQSVPVEDLVGLVNSETFTMAAVKFDLRREAGSLAFEGSFRDGR